MRTDMSTCELHDALDRCAVKVLLQNALLNVVEGQCVTKWRAWGRKSEPFELYTLKNFGLSHEHFPEIMDSEFISL